jgi:hypothetical protein
MVLRPEGEYDEKESESPGILSIPEVFQKERP